MGIVTALEVQKRNKERVNVYLDHEYAFSLNLMDAARLQKGQALTESQIAEMKADDEVAKAVDRAVRFLSYRPRSTQEVRRNLQEKAVDESVIETAISKLNTLGYLDDHAFARFWVENRMTFKPLGTTALRYELRQKGVPDTVIEEVLTDLDTEAAVYAAASARLTRLQGQDQRTFKTKMSSYLQRRGFAYDVIRTVIARLIEEAESGYFSAENADDDEDDTL
jgi:regulatory protein